MGEKKKVFWGNLTSRNDAGRNFKKSSSTRPNGGSVRLTVLRWRPLALLGPGSSTCTPGSARCSCSGPRVWTRRLRPPAGSPVGGAQSAAAAWARPAGATPRSRLWKERKEVKGHESKERERVQRGSHAILLSATRRTYFPATGPGCSSEGWRWSSGLSCPAAPPLICPSVLGSGRGNLSPLA